MGKDRKIQEALKLYQLGALDEDQLIDLCTVEDREENVDKVRKKREKKINVT